MTLHTMSFVSMLLSPLVILFCLISKSDVLINAEHPSTFNAGNNYKHHDYGDVTGYKCPAGSKVNKRAPKSPYTCPAGSDPAVTIKWGYTKSGSNIYQSFGKTALSAYKKKKMCGSEKGRFVTGAPNDPYPSLLIARGNNRVNTVLKNKKVVRIMGHVNGLMCSRMRPRLNIHLNPGGSRSVIMPNTWDDEDNTMGSAKFSIQPPCLERDGKNGRSDNAYDGRAIEYNYPGGSKSYGTCSFKKKDLPCHRSPDFDTGMPPTIVDSVTKKDATNTFSSMDGLLGWNPAGTNVFKLELHCGDGIDTTIFAGGLATTGNCQTTQQHWIRVDSYKYRMERQGKIKLVLYLFQLVSLVLKQYDNHFSFFFNYLNICSL
jgi:hypothetical protein